MKQLTVRDIDPRLARHLRELARKERISLEQAAVRLMRRGAGLDDAPSAHVIGDRLDDLIGTWSDEEAAEFHRALADMEGVDEER